MHILYTIIGLALFIFFLLLYVQALFSVHKMNKLIPSMGTRKMFGLIVVFVWVVVCIGIVGEVVYGGIFFHCLYYGLSIPIIIFSIISLIEKYFKMELIPKDWLLFH